MPYDATTQPFDEPFRHVQCDQKVESNEMRYLRERLAQARSPEERRVIVATMAKQEREEHAFGGPLTPPEG